MGQYACGNKGFYLFSRDSVESAELISIDGKLNWPPTTFFTEAKTIIMQISGDSFDMADKITFKYSTINYKEYFNSSESTMNRTGNEETF